MDSNNKPLTAEDARALIDAERRQRTEGATAELNEFLKVWGTKWRAQIVPVWVVRGDRATHTVEVEALE